MLRVNGPSGHAVRNAKAVWAWSWGLLFGGTHCGRPILEVHYRQQLWLGDPLSAVANLDVRPFSVPLSPRGPGSMTLGLHCVCERPLGLHQTPRPHVDGTQQGSRALGSGKAGGEATSQPRSGPWFPW